VGTATSLCARRCIGTAIAVALASCAALGASGQVEPAPDVDALVREALANSPQLANRRALADAARQAVAPAGALPDPMLELMRERSEYAKLHSVESTMTMYGVELTQTLPFPGKRGAERRSMAAETVVRERELEAMQRLLVADVRRAYATLYALDQSRTSLVAAEELVDLLVATVAARYSSGEDALEAQLKMQVEKARVRERLDDLVAERAVTHAAMNRLLARDSDTPLGPVLALPEVSLPSGQWTELAQQSAAEVAVRSADVDAAGRRLDAARRGRAPDFLAGVAYAKNGEDASILQLRFGFELPLWYWQKQRPRVAAARSEQHAAEQALRDARIAAAAEAVRLQAAWRRDEAQVARYRDLILPQLSTAFDAARSAYMTGRSDFSTVVEDYRLWLDARIELARREADRFETWAEIQALLGLESTLQEDQP
jgi:outer membrane protein TolC